MVKCFAQEHKRTSRIGRDSNSRPSGRASDSLTTPPRRSTLVHILVYLFILSCIFIFIKLSYLFIYLNIHILLDYNSPAVLCRSDAVRVRRRRGVRAAQLQQHVSDGRVRLDGARLQSLPALLHGPEHLWRDG